MKTTMMIPSYWAREAGLGARKTDAVYDHPTPVDHDGTLRKALESIKVLNDTDFNLVVIAAANAEAALAGQAWNEAGAKVAEPAPGGACH